MRLVFEKLNVLSRDVEAIITSKLLLLFYSQLVLLPMCEQTTVEQFLITELLLGQDTNVAAHEVLQLRLLSII
ncbi:lipopolysaccharide exporter [Trichinella spiralis]|uniref:lipopolysaccharide exporter n=1 Tax=Trichinella spiralis TaxID=6334 RepID=UPI0001EFE848|nr:lipopolysaccharide exporter [Trichinella spiralis]